MRGVDGVSLGLLLGVALLGGGCPTPDPDPGSPSSGSGGTSRIPIPERVVDAEWWRAMMDYAGMRQALVAMEANDPDAALDALGVDDSPTPLDLAVTMLYEIREKEDALRQLAILTAIPEPASSDAERPLSAQTRLAAALIAAEEGRFAFAKDLHVDARRHLRRSIDLIELPWAHRWRSLIDVEEGDELSGERWALHSQALLRPAWDAKAAGNHEEAAFVLRVVLLFDPEDHITRAELGELYRHYVRDRARSKECFTKVLEHDDAPDYARALALRGLGYEAEVDGDVEGAKRLYEASLETFPLAWTHRSLAALAVVGHRDYATAEKHARLALEIDPDDPIARLHLASYLAHEGKRAEALKVLGELGGDGASCHAPQDGSGSTDCLDYNLACVRANLGETDVAVALLKRYFEIHASSEAFRAEMSARARADPDFDGIRSDPRFRELVGGD